MLYLKSTCYDSIAGKTLQFISLENKNKTIRYYTKEEILPSDWKTKSALEVGIFYKPKISNMESDDSFLLIKVKNFG